MSLKTRSFLPVLMSLLLAACGKQVEPPVRIGIHVWPGYDTMIVARDQGLLDEAGVKLVETPSATESIRAFQNETVDGAFLTLDEVLRLSDHGHDPVIVLVMDFSNGADAVLGQPGITNLGELEGKRVGVEPNALGAYMLARTLASAGLETADVTTVSMPIVETESAFMEKRVDAIVTYEPHVTRIKNAGGNLLFDSTEIPGEITDVLVVRRNVVAQSPKALQQLVDSQFKVLTQLTSGSMPVLSAMAEREKVSVNELGELLASLTLPDRLENQSLLSQSDARLSDAIARLATIMREHELLSSSFSEQEYRDDQFVKGDLN